VIEKHMHLRNSEDNVAALQVDAALDTVDVARAIGSLESRRCRISGAGGPILRVAGQKRVKRSGAHAPPQIVATGLRGSFAGIAGDVLEVHAGGSVLHHDGDVIGAQPAHGA
jgi:hypothetical protein